MSDDAEEEASFQQTILLLDTNTIQYALHKECGPQVQAFLDELVSVNDGVLSISEIVIFESLKSIAFKPSKRDKVSDFIDSNLTRYQVNHSVLIGAAQMHEMMGAHDATKNYRQSITSEDLIIGVTAILTQGYIITSDCNDFPGPFFDVKHKDVIYYNEKGRRKHVVMYIIQPDMEIINEVFNNQEASSKTKPKKAKE